MRSIAQYMFESEPKIRITEEVPPSNGGDPDQVVYQRDLGSLWTAYNTTEYEKEVALVCFHSLYEFRYGYPNDEGMHPLSKYGVPIIGLCLVENSPRISQIVDEQKPDNRRKAGWHSDYRHWIWKFKEQTLEVIGKRLEVVGTYATFESCEQFLFNFLGSQQNS